jgi:dephospho-CoA kinase
MSEFKGNGFTKDNGTFKFEKLLKLLQTDLIKHYEKWRLVNKESKYTIFKSQILFENNYDDFMNLTISVFKPDSIRVSEMQESTKMKAMEIYNLLDNEMDPYTKNIKCTYTIHNYENFTESLERQIAQIHKSILGKIPKIKYEYT